MKLSDVIVQEFFRYEISYVTDNYLCDFNVDDPYLVNISSSWVGMFLNSGFIKVLVA